jgi:ribosomal silencing factor RsfS
LHTTTATTKDADATTTTTTLHDHLNDHAAQQQEQPSPKQQQPSEEQQEDLDVTEWVPPDRPLPGDLGQTHLYDRTTTTTTTTTSSNTRHSSGARATESASASASPLSPLSPPDWLSTRRKALSMDVPDTSRKFAGAELEVLEGRLLSVTEIVTCLTAMGARQVTSVPDPQKRMGGADGIVFATATSSAHLQLLTETLVRQLKVRKLGDHGVEGAYHGAARKGTDWEVIHCYNYIVHIMLEQTRRDLNLEALWNGQDPLFTLKLNDEATVDEYVANHPVPDTYGVVMDLEDVGKRISELQRWNIGHRAVIPKPKRTKPGARSRASANHRSRS